MTEFKLKELLEIKNGRDYKHLSEGNIPVYGSGGLMRYVDEALYQGESILLPRKGTLTNIQYVNETFWTVDTIYYSIVDKDKADPYFLYYYLKQLDLSHLNTGTGVPSMTFGAYYDIPIKLPKLEAQKKISKILSDLDAKIELNNKINSELEAMAKLIYDYWFVQFDFPNEKGKPYKSSGGKMVYNEALKREIPEGWEVKDINEIIEVKDGTHDSPKSQDYGFKLITSKHLKTKGLDFEKANYISEEDYKNINKRSQVNTGDILFSMIGNIGTVYKIEEKTIDFAIKNVALYKTSAHMAMRNYVYIYLRGYDMQRYMGNVIAGSIQKFIGLGSLRKMPLMNDSKTISKFEEKTNFIFKEMNVLKVQNQKLAELRDWLLPMLMNGQVRVN
jgi:type I restriction enzyme S subunit